MKNVRTIITSYLTTKGEELEKEMAKLFVNSINTFIKVIKENVAVVVDNGRRFFLEEEGMGGKKGREILDSFKGCAKSDQKGVLCATMFGRFSEGVGFPGKELEGIFLVEMLFERLTVKTKLYINYFQKLYGKRDDKYYAYILPALKRVSQALGRALRSKEDKAVFVLGDRRYLNLLPDFISKSYRTTRNLDEPSKESLKYYLL